MCVFRNGFDIFWGWVIWLEYFFFIFNGDFCYEMSIVGMKFMDGIINFF